MTRKAMLLSFLGGFLSLSVEVIWIRLLGFLGRSLPQAFSLTLALFLLGIAFGALIGKKVCQEGKASIDYIGRIFLISALFDIAAIFLVIIATPNTIFPFAVLSIFFCALLRGIVFPIVHHLGSENKTGAAISNVYFSNVVGCTITPIFIGFYLLDIFTTQQTYFVVIVITLIVAYFCLNKIKIKAVSGILAMLTLAATFTLPEKIITNLASYEELELETLIENKHGFIQVYLDKNKDHIVLGGNVYDGMLNVDLNHNSNGIHRAYLLPVIAPQAKNILVIGLSTGSWVRVLTAAPEIESITVIELNPAYVKLASSYPEMAHLLKDKRVNIITDDGRRWLNKNPDKKFDFILMNTTFHWRSYITNLLSQEFLQLAKKHLNEDGFIYFNTTSSYDAHHTSKSVFPYAYEYSKMSLASLKPLSTPSREQISNTLARLKWEENRPVFTSDEELMQGVEKIIKFPLVKYQDIDFSVLNRKPEIITDTNMITEYKYGRLRAGDNSK